MAGGARDVLRRLVVDWADWRDCVREGGRIRLRMALQAERVHIADVQQARVGRAVRRVAAHAAFRLHDRVLIGKRAGRLAVALRANGILVGGRTKILAVKRAVRIVAVAAGDEAFLDAVMKGLRKRGLNVGVALEAKLRLLGFEQMLRRFGGMDAVAAGAADALLCVLRAREVGVRPAVAAQAGLVDLRGRHFGEAANLRDVAPALDVRLARTMAAFAGDAFTGVLEREPGVRIGSEFLHDIFVAGGAGVLPDKVGGLRCRLLCGRRGGLLTRTCGQRHPVSREPGQEQKTCHAGY